MVGSDAGTNSPQSDVRTRALTLIGSMPTDGVAAGSSPLDRLCRAAVRGLDLSGAVVTVTSSAGAERVGVSDPQAARIGELEFSIGEGPVLDVVRTHRPVLTPDLAEAISTTWPAYGRAATDRGVAAVFVFPLHVGAIYFGTLSLFASKSGSLGHDRSALALTFAELATEYLLDGTLASDGSRDGTRLAAAIDAHAEVYQAQGMVMVQLGIDLADALARLRALAYAQDRDLAEVARDVVAGRERIERDN